jgi:V8-like Glu-specific endopeptidase
MFSETRGGALGDAKAECIRDSVCRAYVVGLPIIRHFRPRNPALSPPRIGPEANRSPVDMNAAPWRGVGVLETEVGEHCTGALVGPRAVLTAAHCLFGPISLHLIQPNSIHFLVG